MRAPSRSSWRACVFNEDARGAPSPAISKKELPRGDFLVARVARPLAPGNTAPCSRTTGPDRGGSHANDRASMKARIRRAAARAARRRPVGGLGGSEADRLRVADVPPQLDTQGDCARRPQPVGARTTDPRARAVRARARPFPLFVLLCVSVSLWLITCPLLLRSVAPCLISSGPTARPPRTAPARTAPRRRPGPARGRGPPSAPRPAPTVRGCGRSRTAGGRRRSRW